MTIIWLKIRHFHTTKSIVYDAKTKLLMCQNGLFTIYLSLVYEGLDMSKSTSTYCWSHLFTNSGNLVAHLILSSMVLTRNSILFYFIKWNHGLSSESQVKNKNHRRSCLISFITHGVIRDTSNCAQALSKSGSSWDLT